MNEYGLKDFALQSLQGILFVVCVVLITFCILAVTACAKTKTEYVDKFIEVKVPVPQKCDFFLAPKPDINTSSVQSVYDSVTKLAVDGIEIRKSVELVPCLNIIYE